jgi:hypothetical protein
MQATIDSHAYNTATKLVAVYLELRIRPSRSGFVAVQTSASGPEGTTNNSTADLLNTTADSSEHMTDQIEQYGTA